MEGKINVIIKDQFWQSFLQTPEFMRKFVKVRTILKYENKKHGRQSELFCVNLSQKP